REMAEFRPRMLPFRLKVMSQEGKTASLLHPLLQPPRPTQRNRDLARLREGPRRPCEEESVTLGIVVVVAEGDRRRRGRNLEQRLRRTDGQSVSADLDRDADERLACDEEDLAAFAAPADAAPPWVESYQLPPRPSSRRTQTA